LISPSWAGRAPGFQLELDLADRVARRADAAGVVVEPAIAGKGEDRATPLGQHDCLGLGHQRVLLLEERLPRART
jgi:hypothetical protein